MKIASLTPAEFFTILGLNQRSDGWKQALEAQRRDPLDFLLRLRDSRN